MKSMTINLHTTILILWIPTVAKRTKNKPFSEKNTASGNIDKFQLIEWINRINLWHKQFISALVLKSANWIPLQHHSRVIFMFMIFVFAVRKSYGVWDHFFWSFANSLGYEWWRVCWVRHLVAFNVKTSGVFWEPLDHIHLQQ